jgi:hypothetical protein
MLEQTINIESIPLRLRRILLAMHEVVADVAMEPAWATRLTRDNAHRVLSNYVALSQAFPYLMAGAQGVVFRCALDSGDPGAWQSAEATFAVAAYICAEETGANYLLASGGASSLPRLLDTSTAFHANLLSADLGSILGLSSRLHAEYSDCTRRYLEELGAFLSDSDPVVRSAHMVAHEVFAGIEISSMSRAIDKALSVQSRTYDYFRIHVGNDDPAEAHHIEMTSRLVDKVVPEGGESSFVDLFEEAYAFNIDWTRRLCA